MTARSVRLLMAAAGLLAARPAAALPIVYLDLERSIRGEASASAPGFADHDDAEYGSSDPGFFTAHERPAAEDGVAFGVAAFAIPNMEGNAGPDGIAAYAVAESSAVARLPDSFALSSAEVLHRIVFQVTSDTLVRLTGHARAFGSGAGDSFALVELASVGDPSDPLLRSIEAAPGDAPAAIDVVLALEAGVTYRLLALARTQTDALAAPDVSSFAAGFDVALAEVPEPGTAATLGAGLLALTARRRSTRAPLRD
jgi:hypothetical protein